MNDKMNFQSNDARHGWGKAQREPEWYQEPTGGDGVTGRIIHKRTGQVMARDPEWGNKWRTVPR